MDLNLKRSLRAQLTRLKTGWYFQGQNILSLLLRVPCFFVCYLRDYTGWLRLRYISCLLFIFLFSSPFFIYRKYSVILRVSCINRYLFYYFLSLCESQQIESSSLLNLVYKVEVTSRKQIEIYIQPTGRDV